MMHTTPRSSKRSATRPTAIGFFLILVNLGLASSQIDAQTTVSKNRVTIHTNSETCSLHNPKNGQLLARADASGRIQWEPDVLRRSMKKVEIRGTHLIPETLKIRRRLRLGSVLLSGLETGLATVAVSDYVNDVGSTSLPDYQEHGILGAGGGVLIALFSNKNYIVSPKSRDIDIELKHDPKFMKEQWQLVKNQNSIRRINEFKKAYPEFPFMDEVDGLFVQLKQAELEASLLKSAQHLLESPSKIVGWQTSTWNKTLREMEALASKYEHLDASSDVADRLDFLRSEQQDILSSSQSPSPFEGLLSIASAAPTEASHEWRLAAWMRAWNQAPPEERRRAIEELQSVPTSWAKRILLDANFQRDGGDAMISDWQDGLTTTGETVIGFASVLKTTRLSYEEATRRVDDHHWPLEAGFTSLLITAWNDQLAQWRMPEDVKTEMVQTVWNAIQFENDMDAQALLAEWSGVLVAEKNANIKHILALVPDPLNVADVSSPISIGDGAILELLPPEFDVSNPLWANAFPELETDTASWFIIGDSLNSRDGFTLGFTSGRSLSFALHEKKKPELRPSNEPWDGTYRGIQESHPMRRNDGTVMRVAGKTIEIPATTHIVRLSGTSINVRQSSGETSAVYEGHCFIEPANYGIDFFCDLSNLDGSSTPSCRLEFDAENGNLNLTWDNARTPSVSLNNPEFQGPIQPEALEVWVLRDSTGKLAGQLVTEWAPLQQEGRSKRFFGENPMPTLQIADGRVVALDELKSFLQMSQSHPGWSTSTSNGKQNAHEELQSLLWAVRESLDALAVYSEMEDTLLPVPIHRSEIQSLEAVLASLESNYAGIERKILEAEERAEARNKKARSKYEGRIFKSGYIYLEFKYDGTFATYQKTSPYRSAATCYGSGSWQVDGQQVVLSSNSSRCESNWAVTGRFLDEGYKLTGEMNFYEVD